MVAAVVGHTPFEQVKFHLHKDGALGGIVQTASKNTPESEVATYSTVTLEHVLKRMGAPSMMDYLSLDVEGK